MWLCRCECGSERVINGIVLRDERSRSCGCLKSEVTTARSTKHGHSSNTHLTPTYHSWVGMMQRCTNPNSRAYADYGGRGIKVCARWRAFANFLEDMGEKPLGLSLDRLDNDRAYGPNNCRWATAIEQARNKRSSRVIEFGGRRLVLSEWAAILGLNQSSLSERIKRWGLERALTTPRLR